MSKIYPDPGPPPPETASTREREAHARADEKFLMEGGKAGVSKVPATVDPTDKRLRELNRDHRAFMNLHSPVKASLWLALLRPAKDVIHDVEMTRRFREAQRGNEEGAYVAPERPSIVELGQQIVAKGLEGDISAIREIAERIEGKAGLRVGDDDPEEPGRKKQTQQIVSSVIAAMTQKRIAENVTDAKFEDVTPSPPPERKAKVSPPPPVREEMPPPPVDVVVPDVDPEEYERELAANVMAIDQLSDEVQAQEGTRRALEAEASAKIQAEARLAAREKALVENQAREKIHAQERADREAKLRIEAEARIKARLPRRFLPLTKPAVMPKDG